MATGDLQEYNRKRNFTITPEPAGNTIPEEAENLSFCIQKHNATRLHYDLRLELDGVLKSWAVTKGPSYDPKVKRLAMRTEDHPLSYGDFEGLIPKGQYGAGPVMLWDSGEWIPKGDPHEGLKKGKLAFTLKGEKMQGDWALILMKDREKKGGKPRESWLLVKERDSHAIDGEAAEGFLKQEDYSIKSGRTLPEIESRARPHADTRAAKELAQTSKELEALARKYKGVQLATLVDHPPSGDNWLHEVKYDGYRVLCILAGGSARVYTRNGHDWTDKFGPLAASLELLPVEAAVLDGEAVILDHNGISSFKKLQNAFKSSGINDIRCYFFDLLHLNGHDLRKQSQIKRKEKLSALFSDIQDERLLYSDHLRETGDKVINKACEMGLEGIISKRADAPYSASRTKYWLKSKCSQWQEFIICGFVPASDRKNAIGALHLGYHSNGKLVYAGKVGTGFSHAASSELFQKLEPLKANVPPFDEKLQGRFPKTVWTSPDLICEVQFGSWTGEGKVRHASYQGLRADKVPEQIARDEPETLEKVANSKKTRSRKSATKDLRVLGVNITHPDRVIFPESKITKGELAEFYSDVTEVIMPLIARRPLSVIRCPGGIETNCFFQRSRGKGMPEHIYRFDVTHKCKPYDYLYIEEPMGLIELVQMSTIEVHPWGATIDKIHHPDRVIFDLDPDPAVPFEAVKLAAQDIRNRLEARGLKSFLKTTGGKGLHVTAPLDQGSDWDAVKSFARSFARELTSDAPEAYTATISKSKRKGKILIDYFRNDFTATAVMEFSVRSRPGAPVAVPLYWDELKDLKKPDQFSLAEARKRLEMSKKWIKDFMNTSQALPDTEKT